ncbi:AlbA family DNA-binding domain-containing protein [Streptomyces niveus]|uniref:AlbA family DNA-binding domain-containing protein n=1 Tax=Streptomyces niveus TaxID=193462 RepID=UPI0036B1F052
MYEIMVDAESGQVSLNGEVFFDVNYGGDFEIERDWLNEVCLTEIKKALGGISEVFRESGEHSLSISLSYFGDDDPTVRDGELDERAYFFDLSESGDLVITSSVSFPLAKTPEEFHARVGDYFTRHHVKIVSERFCGGSSSLELKLSPPLHWTVVEYTGFFEILTLILQKGRINFTSPSGVRALVMAGIPEALLGSVENDWLDVKRQGYGISAASQKYEFSCDVASFANAEQGGVIVLGIATEVNSSGSDVLCSVVPCRRGSLNVQKYRHALRERVVPPIDGLEIDVVELPAGDVLCVYVPPQPEELKPFLVKGAMVDGKVSGSYFSIPHRRGSDKWAMSAESVHSMLVAARVILKSNSTSG